MFGTIRSKFGPWVVGGIIGLIVLVFILSDIFNSQSARGLGGGGNIGSVDGEPITQNEFNQALNRQLEFFRAFQGGNLPDEMLSRVKDGVFEDLVVRKIKVSEARKMDLSPGSQEVMDKIREMPVFQNDAKQFDLLKYKQLLQANNYTPERFERLVSEDIMVEKWSAYLRERVKANEEEIRLEFQNANDQRNIKFVVIPPAPAAEKGKPAYDAAKLAEGVLPLVSKKADPKTDSQANAYLKPHGIQVRNTGMIPRTTKMIPGLGEAEEVLKDAFVGKGEPKVYSLSGRVVVAWVVDSKKPDWNNYAKEREKLEQQVVAKKERELEDGWIQRIRKGAKVVRNPLVFSDQS